MPCCSTSHSAMSSGSLSAHPWQDPPPPGNVISGQLISNFHFWKKKIFLPKFFFTSKKIFPFSLFYKFLDVLCQPECSRNFLPKIFLGEARRDTMLPSISSFLTWMEHSKRLQQQKLCLLLPTVGAIRVFLRLTMMSKVRIWTFHWSVDLWWFFLESAVWGQPHTPTVQMRLKSLP